MTDTDNLFSLAAAGKYLAEQGVRLVNPRRPDLPPHAPSRQCVWEWVDNGALYTRYVSSHRFIPRWSLDVFVNEWKAKHPVKEQE